VVAIKIFLYTMMIPDLWRAKENWKLKRHCRRGFSIAINKSEIIIFFAALASRRLKTWTFSSHLVLQKKKRITHMMKNGFSQEKNRREGGWKEDRCLKLEIQTAATRMLILLSIYYFFDDGALKKLSWTHVILFNMMVEAIRDESQPLWKLN
jgi:hypothetical protein